MARQTFFSFHHKNDVTRAGVVRNSWVTKDSAGFWDAAEWEQVKKKNTEVIHKWIDEQMKGTSVTAVLIGSETAARPHVQYEIKQSIAKGNGLLGIYVHAIKDLQQKTTVKGANPLPSGYSTYDWVAEDGHKNLATWIEAAAKKAGK